MNTNKIIMAGCLAIMMMASASQAKHHKVSSLDKISDVCHRMAIIAGDISKLRNAGVGKDIVKATLKEDIIVNSEAVESYYPVLVDFVYTKYGWGEVFWRTKKKHCPKFMYEYKAK